MVSRAVPGMERPRERASFSVHESQGEQDWGGQEGREGEEERDGEGGRGEVVGVGVGVADKGVVGVGVGVADKGVVGVVKVEDEGVMGVVEVEDEGVVEVEDEEVVVEVEDEGVVDVCDEEVVGVAVVRVVEVEGWVVVVLCGRECDESVKEEGEGMLGEELAAVAWEEVRVGVMKGARMEEENGSADAVEEMVDIMLGFTALMQLREVLRVMFCDKGRAAVGGNVNCQQ